ncbi:MAG: hypothetical protein A3B38_03420 [Candidatus Levybacteria bacterium RIFCSPLOWO2_01_FULL_36_13]|nr:MAG: hypothetical protein A2684_04365 [Candidatus Levybacteria bacterium RIFCSPHIGHO2_01_FULL_36_15b]OGH34726.1 MAG: hypothetical protein A3B38_03420 [Candidatus Levybacteria bacterium RIFCSPLOWO2_01_FULL_36_13]
MVERSQSFLAQNVKTAMLQERLSYRGMSKRTGADSVQIYRVAESKTVDPGIEVAAKLLIHFGKVRAYEILLDTVSAEIPLFTADNFIAQGNVGAQLRQYRERRKMSARDVEENYGVGWRDVLRLERNERMPRIRTVATLVEAYGLNVDQTFNLLQAAALGRIKKHRP